MNRYYFISYYTPMLLTSRTFRTSKYLRTGERAPKVYPTVFRWAPHSKPTNISTTKDLNSIERSEERVRQHNENIFLILAPSSSCEFSVRYHSSWSIMHSLITLLFLTLDLFLSTFEWFGLRLSLPYGSVSSRSSLTEIEVEARMSVINVYVT